MRRLLFAALLALLPSRALAFGGHTAAFKGVASPLSIPNAYCWLRSDLGITIGTGVSTWANQRSGISCDGTQATAGKQPAYASSGGLNNRAVLTFNASKALEWALPLSGAKTVLVVMDQASEPHTGFSIFSIKHDTGGGGVFFSEMITDLATYQYTSYLDGILGGAGPGNMTGHNDTLGTTGHVLLHTYDGGTWTSTSSYTVYLDGVLKTSTASGLDGRVDTDLGSIGARLDSGSSISFGYDGDIYEIAVWNRVLTAVEIKALSLEYAKRIYGL